MNHENDNLRKIIKDIDIVVAHMVDDKDNTEALYEDDSIIAIAFDKLMDLREDLEKQIWLNNNPEYNKEESHN